MESMHPKSSPRDVFLYLLAIGTLYISVWRFIDLLFEYINYAFPDVLEYGYHGGFNASIRWSMSSLLIVFPVYLGVTWYLRKDAIGHPEKRELRVRKWLLNFTLFLAAVTIIADLVTLVNKFLEGELTPRFLLKVLVVFVTAGAVFAYYLWDLRRETRPESKPSRAAAAATAVVVLGSIVSGFFIVGSPAQQRLRRFDERRISDLQMIQNEIINYWTRKDRLPAALGDLTNDISGFAPPSDPETDMPYEYRTPESLKFELCAAFRLPSTEDAFSKPVPYPPEPYGQNWRHEAGRACFTRTIDPELYRPQLQVKPLSRAQFIP